MNDNDGTPQALPEWETGPHRDPADPHNYLVEPPTDTTQRLADALDREAANVHLAAIALRLWGVVQWIKGADGREKLARRIAGIVVTAAFANVAAIVYHWQSGHDAQIVAATEARAARETELEYRRGVNQRIDQLEQSMRLIQRALMRMSGGDDHPPTSDELRVPDRYSIRDVGGGGSVGGISPQCPKLHLPHPLCGLIWHSALLEQMSLQNFGVGSGFGGSGCTGGGGDPHPAAIAIRNTMTLDMGMLYPWLRNNMKEIAP